MRFAGVGEDQGEVVMEQRRGSGCAEDEDAIVFLREGGKWIWGGSECFYLWAE